MGFEKVVIAIFVILLAWALFNPTLDFLTTNSFVSTNNGYELPEEVLDVVYAASEQNSDDGRFAIAIYNVIDERFTSEHKCWAEYPTRNLLKDYEKIWALEGECLPCHIQAKLYNKMLLASGRFEEEDIKTKFLRCGTTIHYYTQVHVNNEWINIDVWGKEWEVPFGSTIQDVEGIC